MEDGRKWNLNEKVTFDDPNTFILVDESHRTQGGDMHKAMKKVFPEACYLGFTGTPLMRREKNSFAKFGGEIHRYTINQAVEDKAVLPLLYEGRLVDQWVNDEKRVRQTLCTDSQTLRRGASA